MFLSNEGGAGEDASLAAFVARELLTADLSSSCSTQIVLPMGYIYSVSGYSVSVGYFNEVSVFLSSSFISVGAKALLTLLFLLDRFRLHVSSFVPSKSAKLPI